MALRPIDILPCPNLPSTCAGPLHAVRSPSCSDISDIATASRTIGGAVDEVTPSRIRMHRKQVLIAFQVVPQPLILTSMSRQDICTNLAAAAQSSNSLRRNSSFSKRDSAVFLGQTAGPTSDVRRTSVRRSFQSSEEVAFIEDDLAEFLAEKPACNMGPVYRLVR